MNANFGLLPPLEPGVRNKRKRRQQMADRALEAMKEFVSELVGVEA
jgi:methylenetetrahydrofolate--tRNA-(uracil-5-)-methyltransferase